MKILNLFAGPSAGKSTTAAAVFAEMKILGYEVEMSMEYAKDLIYSNRSHMLSENQDYIFAKQHYRLNRLIKNGVDWVIADSPLLLSDVYIDDEQPGAEEFAKYVHAVFQSYDNLNVFLVRPETFQESGRVHNLEQSKQLDNEVINVLETHNYPYEVVETNDKVVDNILDLVRSFDDDRRE